ncbi:hypothetical protein [Buttiauxella izardii]|uniref:Uncharacterized protein n=1 Tax=Buttiauxella izardii TaxID=82991 RepID=A0A3A5K1P2_9ENTR|nr:hypothetical protein [Buttiauxella izardii]RJT26569.1 hypothetical protein D6029_05910 [Buttiauxella izardii]
MSVYHVSTRINSNVPASEILYDLCIYRIDSERRKHSIVDVKQQALLANYETQPHATENISEPISTIYIMEVILYRQTMLKTLCISSTPFTKMYTLEEFASGKAWSPVKRENPCYFQSTGTTKLQSKGDNIAVINISRPERPFIAKDYPIGSSQDPFEKTLIAQQITRRFNQVDYPNQFNASLCGPAAFFYCLQKDRPDVYAQAAQELWRSGKTKIGQLEITPSGGCRHPMGHLYGDISGLDWMTLAGLRDSENKVLSFDSLDSPLAGITLWGTLTEWFEKAGYEKVFINVGITQAGIQGINELNEYIQKGYKVVSLINDSLLQGSLSERTTYPTHWIVWNGPVTQASDGTMHLNLFSWGDLSDQIKPGRDTSFFISRFFGGVVFKPLK